MTLYQLLIILHIVSAAIGVGGATISDMLFFRSIRDEKISSEELGILNAVSRVVQIGFIFLLLTGIGLVYLKFANSGINDFNLSNKINAKITIITIIYLNSLVLHFTVIPLFKRYKDQDFGAVLRQHRIAIFTSGAISAVSWYSALILGAWKGLNVPYTTIILAYVAVIILAALSANIFGIMFVGILKKISLKDTKQPSEEHPLPPRQE